jgi:D-alanyl-D-alanine endopeptidase (penicillin-binding protein 7)
MDVVRVVSLLLVFLAGHTLASQAGDSRFAGLKGNPNLKSASAIVLDESGNIIYGKDVNTVRPIASITKLMTAMVVLDANLDLNEKLTITREDRDLIRLTGSRLEYGATLSRRELILLALMSSENRAATALGRTYPGGMDNFVDHMNRKARALGMSNSHFADPAGLKTENVSTASDLAKMITAAEGYPLITQSTTTTRMEVRPYSRRGRTQQDRLYQRGWPLPGDAGQYRGRRRIHRTAELLRQTDTLWRFQPPAQVDAGQQLIRSGRTGSKHR